MKHQVRVGPINVICPKATKERLENVLTMAKLMGYKVDLNWTLDFVAASYVGWVVSNGKPSYSDDYRCILEIYFITKQPRKQQIRRLRGKLKSERVTNVLSSIEICFSSNTAPSYVAKPDELEIFDLVLKGL